MIILLEARERLSDFMGSKLNNKGFSLIELIVVITIMVILMAILVPNVVKYVGTSQEASAKNSANTIYSAAQNYIVGELAAGKTFEPNSVLQPSVLWSEGVDLLTPLKQSEVVEIKLNSTGTLVEYVYYTNGGVEADYPQGSSGKITE